MVYRYGIAEPVRREMELAGVRAGDGMGFTGLRTGGGGKSVSEEVLRGEEAEIGGWEGVFGTGMFESSFLLRCVKACGRHGRGKMAEEDDADGSDTLGDELREGDFHGELEAKAKMNW